MQKRRYIKFILGFSGVLILMQVFMPALIIGLWGGLSVLNPNWAVKNDHAARKEWAQMQADMDCNILPVHCAVRDHKLDAIPDIIAKGFPKNAQDARGETALFYVWQWAPREDAERLMGLLLKANVDPDIGDIHGDFLLWQMIRGHHYDLAVQLVSAGATSDIKIGTENKKMTLLTETITQKDVEGAEFLVKHGASLSLKDDYGYNACERARLYNTSSLFSFCNTL